jgi:hypothetical protein
MFTELRDWCRGRSALVRLPILVYFAWIGFTEYQDPMESVTVRAVNFFPAINLCIHEGGHLIMRPFGIEIIHCAGGTALQLAAPIICMVLLLKQRDYFGIPVCLAWLSTNLVGVGLYMADARARELPLVTAEGSDGITTHDWAEMFTYTGLMCWDTIIGFWTRAAGTGAMIAALVIGFFMLSLMLFPGEKPPEPMDLKKAAIRSRSAL